MGLDFGTLLGGLFGGGNFFLDLILAILTAIFGSFGGAAG